MSKYHCPTSPNDNTSVDTEIVRDASCAFGVALLTPKLEAEIDRELGVSEAHIQAFLEVVADNNTTPMDDLDSLHGPTEEDLREIES